VVCHDAETEKLALDLNFPPSAVIKLSALLLKYPELAEAKEDRSGIEFIFCLTPYVIRYILDVIEYGEVVYIDADMQVTGTPENLFLETRESDFAITSHNFLPRLQELSEFGRFNVGVIFVRSSSESNNLLIWWSKKCIESTSIHSTNPDVFGDQKYLDQFPKIYPELTVYENPGINSAPWNCDGVIIRDGSLTRTDGHQIETFHFSGLSYNKYFFVSGFNRYGMRLPKSIRVNLYQPYVKELIGIEKVVNASINRGRSVSFRKFIRGFIYRDLAIHSNFRKKMN
jgi:hypothetical protein